MKFEMTLIEFESKYGKIEHHLSPYADQFGHYGNVDNCGFYRIQW